MFIQNIDVLLLAGRQVIISQPKTNVHIMLYIYNVFRAT
jgi:hypothetical protein